MFYVYTDASYKDGLAASAYIILDTEKYITSSTSVFKVDSCYDAEYRGAITALEEACALCKSGKILLRTDNKGVVDAITKLLNTDSFDKPKSIEIVIEYFPAHKYNHNVNKLVDYMSSYARLLAKRGV